MVCLVLLNEHDPPELPITWSVTCSMSGFHWLIDVIFLIKYEMLTKRNTREIQPRDQIAKGG